MCSKLCQIETNLYKLADGISQQNAIITTKLPTTVDVFLNQGLFDNGGIYVGDKNVTFTPGSNVPPPGFYLFGASQTAGDMSFVVLLIDGEYLIVNPLYYSCTSEITLQAQGQYVGTSYYCSRSLSDTTMTLYVGASAGNTLLPASGFAGAYLPAGLAVLAAYGLGLNNKKTFNINGIDVSIVLDSPFGPPRYYSFSDVTLPEGPTYFC